MACVVVTKTALSVRVGALTDAGEKSTPSAPKIGLENRAKLEARLRSVEAESDFTVYDALPCDLISRSVCKEISNVVCAVIERIWGNRLKYNAL
jgi:hypothetical protein